MKMLYLVSLVMAAAAVSGNVAHNGNCPDLKPVENFNSTAYAGVWYEVSKYPYESEKKEKCASTEYTLEGQVIKVKNAHVVDGVQTSIEGTAKLAPNANNTGKLVVSCCRVGDNHTPLWILATDYANYAIAYNCKYDEKKKNHEDFAWILSRSKKLEGDAKTAVDNFIKATTELDSAKFMQTDFSEDACKFTSSNVITETPVKAA